nr:hypothetical protein [uncultured Sphingomonas sp.]
MTTGQIIELIAAAALIIGGIWMQRRRAHDGSRTGSQGGVILMVVGALVAIHGLGLMGYRPMPTPVESAQ